MHKKRPDGAKSGMVQKRKALQEDAAKHTANICLGKSITGRSVLQTYT